ncbi:Defensin-like protein, partial [Cucurbita argyrosperma subsp. argyrosperma]
MPRDKKPEVKSDDLCAEGLGECGSDCDQRCKARHIPAENPQGRCNRLGNEALCECLYSCRMTPPPGKVCQDGLGQCSAKCNNDCCSAKCASKHNGGQGYCDTNVGIRLCQCSYPC